MSGKYRVYIIIIPSSGVWVYLFILKLSDAITIYGQVSPLFVDFGCLRGHNRDFARSITGAPLFRVLMWCFLHKYAYLFVINRPTKLEMYKHR